jgi:hypothetical protein
MKSQATTAISLFSGATAIALAVGFGAAGGYVPNSATTTTSSNATQAPQPPAVRGGHADTRASVAPAGCIIGLNCGCIPHRTCR